MATERDRRTYFMNAISDLLGIPRDPKGVGSSVHNSWLIPVCDAVGVDPLLTNKYRRFEALLTWFGAPYDRFVDTSEGSDSGGGGTITNDGLEKLYYAMRADLREARAFADVPELSATLPDEVDPDLPDSRQRVFAEIAVRRGQAAFRALLMEAYGGRCAVTGCDAVEVLEAAHITPYRGAHTNAVGNGLLLRADIHTLFDVGGLGIDPDDGGRVVLSQRVRETQYAGLEGTRAKMPGGPRRPSAALLRRHLALYALS